MSAECTGWVFRHSPAKGAAFAVHLAAADSANDQHDYELWMRQHRLADKARVSRRAVTDALAWLCEHGLLELLESGAQSGSANRYRFLMPDLPVLFDGRGGAQSVPTPQAPRAQGGEQQVLGGVGTTCAQRARENPSDDPKRTALAGADPLGFDDFWKVYPRRAGKGQARPAWKRAAAKATPEEIIAGAARYRDDPNRDASFTKHPSTWLNGECWNDPPLPPRGGAAKRSAREQRLAGRPDGPRRFAEALGHGMPGEPGDDSISAPAPLPPGGTT